MPTYLADAITRDQDTYPTAVSTITPSRGWRPGARAALVANWMMPALDRRERDESGMVSSPSSGTKRPGEQVGRSLETNATGGGLVSGAKGSSCEATTTLELSLCS
jgi:hypothetical protein